jgi:hypothetical protein
MASVLRRTFPFCAIKHNASMRVVTFALIQPSSEKNYCAKGISDHTPRTKLCVRLFDASRPAHTKPATSP